jgi:hypothetical protein
MLVSTCTSQTTFSTQMRVFDSCFADCSVGRATELCHDRSLSGSQVGWLSSTSTNYKVQVFGEERGQEGTFGIFVQDFPAPANNECEDRIPLTLLDAAPTTGSTIGSTRSPRICSRSSDKAGVWYSVIGTGMLMRAHLCHDQTITATRIDILQGSDCSTLSCTQLAGVPPPSGRDFSCGGDSNTQFIASGPGQVTWYSQADQEYFLHVFDSDPSSSFGANETFGIFVEKEIIPPLNNLCESRTPLVLNGPAIGGSNVNATQVTGDEFAESGSCPGQPLANNPGVWFQIEGTGQPFHVIMSCTETAFLTSIVYAGECGSLTCVAESFLTCFVFQVLTFDSEANVIYTINVFGSAFRVGGPFHIHVTDAAPTEAPAPTEPAATKAPATEAPATEPAPTEAPATDTQSPVDGVCISDSVALFTQCAIMECSTADQACTAMITEGDSCADVEGFCQTITEECCPACGSELEALLTCINGLNCKFECGAANNPSVSAEPTPPTAAPPTTGSPVKSSATEAPVPVQTGSPVQDTTASTGAPVPSPTDSPVQRTTGSPVLGATTQAPVPAATDSPVQTPTEAPPTSGAIAANTIYLAFAATLVFAMIG